MPFIRSEKFFEICLKIGAIRPIFQTARNDKTSIKHEEFS